MGNHLRNKLRGVNVSRVTWRPVMWPGCRQGCKSGKSTEHLPLITELFPVDVVSHSYKL